MKLIVKPPYTGKTEELIKLSAEKWHYIVCRNMVNADLIANRAKKLGLVIPNPITLVEFINGNFNRRGIKGFLIDNGEDIFMEFARGVSISAITFTDLYNKELSGGK